MNDLLKLRRFWQPPETAGADGLVGVGGDLRPGTLLRAYSEGVFPWFNEGDPILWWSPDPRSIIELDHVHISRSLARTIRQAKFKITVNQAFAEVIRACATTREEGTWITPTMVNAYLELHRLGHAHSVETWINDQLAGGIYGVAIGGLFAGESMFYRVSNGSKVALVGLVQHLQTRGFSLFDVQMRTEHTTRMGAIDISRQEYLKRVRDAVQQNSTHFLA